MSEDARRFDIWRNCHIVQTNVRLKNGNSWKDEGVWNQAKPVWNI